MYQSHWNLKQRPFDESAEPSFYSPCQPHQSALLKLRYLLDQRKGVGTIVGDHGLGKTMLTHVLEEESREDGVGPFVRLVIPQLSASETLAYLAQRLGADAKECTTQSLVLHKLETLLSEFQESQKHIVFLIDDAHLLNMDHLQALRLLLNLREGGLADFSLILSGRTDLLARLKRISPLDQRVAVRASLRPLEENEVHEYLTQRMRAAGGKPDIFSLEASRVVCELSGGIPRRINQIADLALLVGFVDELSHIGGIEVTAAAEELFSTKAA